MASFFSQYKNVLKILLFAIFGFILYKNFTKITNWLTHLFTNITVDETTTPTKLKDPTYKISPKIIKNYVDTIVTSIDKVGTNEKSLDTIYQNLKSNDISNTVALWNEWNNRDYQYSPVLGQLVTGIKFLSFSASYNLYQVLESELNGKLSTSNQNKEWVNWKYLFKRAGLV